MAAGVLAGIVLIMYEFFW